MIKKKIKKMEKIKWLILPILFLLNTTYLFAGSWFELENSLEFGFGLGYNTNYLNQNGTVSLLSKNFGNGGFESDFKRRSTIEGDVKNLDPTGSGGINELEGGCPDAYLLLRKPVPIRATKGGPTGNDSV